LSSLAGPFRVFRYVTVEHPAAATIAWKNALLNLHDPDAVRLAVRGADLVSLVHDVTRSHQPSIYASSWGGGAGALSVDGARIGGGREPIIRSASPGFLLVLIPSAP
jgi:hypothetical protein